MLCSLTRSYTHTNTRYIHRALKLDRWTMPVSPGAFLRHTLHAIRLFKCSHSILVDSDLCRATTCTTACFIKRMYNIIHIDTHTHEQNAVAMIQYKVVDLSLMQIGLGALTCCVQLNMQGQQALQQLGQLGVDVD